MKELYETNIDFKTYVDKFSRDNNVTVEKALEYAVVKSYAEHLIKPSKKDDWILGK